MPGPTIVELITFLYGLDLTIIPGVGFFKKFLEKILLVSIPALITNSSTLNFPRLVFAAMSFPDLCSEFI